MSAERSRRTYDAMGCRTATSLGRGGGDRSGRHDLQRRNWIDPNKGIGGVYLTQLLPFADRKSLPLDFEFERTVYRHLA